MAHLFPVAATASRVRSCGVKLPCGTLSSASMVPQLSQIIVLLSILDTAKSRSNFLPHFGHIFIPNLQNLQNSSDSDHLLPGYFAIAFIGLTLPEPIPADRLHQPHPPPLLLPPSVSVLKPSGTQWPTNTHAR